MVSRVKLLVSVGVVIFVVTAASLYWYFGKIAHEVDVRKWTDNWTGVQPEYEVVSGEPELIIPEGGTEYRNDKYNFKLAYPADMHVSESDEEGGLTVVFMSEDETKGFQIFVTSYVGWTITDERIKMDIPSGKVENAIEVIIDGTRAMIFFSEHQSIGQTREVWFIHGDYLYEVTVPRELDEWLSHVMTTWRFLKKPEHTVEVR